MKNRVETLRCQLYSIAYHVTGDEGYSLASLREIRADMLDAFDIIDGEIIRREKEPVRGLLDGLSPNRGGAA